MHCYRLTSQSLKDYLLHAPDRIFVMNSVAADLSTIVVLV